MTFKGIETIRKHKLTSIDDERGMLEYELQRMHREAKKNALLAEAEGRIQARADKNTQAYSGIKSTFNVFRLRLRESHLKTILITFLIRHR